MLKSRHYSSSDEYNSRQTIQAGLDHLDRMVPLSRDLPNNMHKMSGDTSFKWTCLPPDSSTNCHNLFHLYQTPLPGQWMHWRGPEPLCLPTSSHFGKSGGEVTGLPVQQNHSDCSSVAQHALILEASAMSSQIQLCLSNLPNLLTQSFNQSIYRNLSNLNFHAWPLEPQQSRSRASLRQWQHKLRLLNQISL